MQSFWIFLQFVFIAAALAYDVGVTHNYKYETTVAVSEDCEDGTENNDPVGHRLSADVHLTSVWQDPKDPLQMLMKIQVSETKLLVPKKSSFEERETGLQKIPKSESYFILKKNRVEKFWDNPEENVAVRNLKRSVVSLLQMNRKDGEGKEVDVSGTCGVLYKVEGNKVRRRKANCRHPLQDTLSSQIFGVRSLSVQHSTGIDCDLRDAASDVVSTCLATERVNTFSNLWKKSSICVHATTLLHLEDTAESKETYKSNDYHSVIEEIKKKSGKLIEGDLMAVSKDKDETKTTNVMDDTKNFQESMKTTNLAKLKSVSAFFKLLPSFKAASKEDILKILKHKNFAAILPQIMDLLAASSTRSSVETVLGFFGDEKDYNKHLERFLISLSVTPMPEAFILDEIKSFLEKGKHHEKIEATLITTLGALVRSNAKSDKVDAKVVGNAVEYLEGGLVKCKGDACILSYLRGLRNAAQVRTIPLLLQYSSKGGKPALEALLALRNIPTQHFSREHLHQLLNVFHQVGMKQDRSSRATAAEILLRSNVGEDVLRSVVGSLSDQSDAEFSTFVVSRLLDMMDENEQLRTRILRILPEKQIAYYYSLSQKGKSSLFKRQLIGTDGLNVTYGIEMELLQGGLLKRSSFDVDFQSESEVSNLLSVGMFAEGLGSFAGVDSSSADEEGSDPSAGLELSLLGHSLRPYVFFSSTSELMGHVWSGTASEPTPALQGIFSLSDDQRAVVLHNGMAVRLELRGAMSTDLSASIQISIWSRNSQSQVKNAAALLVRGSAVVDAEVVRSRGEYLFYGQSAIDFGTDLDFAETPFKMCTQMEHPDVQFRHDFQKSVEVTETKYSIKKTKKRKRFIPSRSFALHQTNNDLCRIMKSGDF